MNDIQTIQNKIYEIRGQKVMSDFDIAEMYGVETRVLNQAVKHVLTDQNDINDDTTMRLELIEQSLAELQVKAKSADRNPIGFRL